MIRTVFFFIYFWVSVMLSSPIALVLWILERLGWKGARFWTGKFVQSWARSVLRVMGVRVEAKGLELLPSTERACFIANHQGDVDILLILASVPRCVGFVTKNQAAWIPFLNIWISALGSVFLDRKRVGRARKSIERGVRRIRSGGALAIFPEGTRSRGPIMGPFRNGSFKLATRAEAVIIPLSLDSTYKVWESERRIVPSTVRFTVGEAIPTAGLSAEEKRELPEIVRRRIQENLPYPA